MERKREKERGGEDISIRLFLTEIRAQEEEKGNAMKKAASHWGRWTGFLCDGNMPEDAWLKWHIALIMTKVCGMERDPPQVLRAEGKNFSEMSFSRQTPTSRESIPSDEAVASFPSLRARRLQNSRTTTRPEPLVLSQRTQTEGGDGYAPLTRPHPLPQNFRQPYKVAASKPQTRSNTTVNLQNLKQLVPPSIVSWSKIRTPQRQRDFAKIHFKVNDRL